ncbi:MAG TPA: nicotinate phosphoribosyltransferase, partial [Synergistaceae bacterium]|nr:nicotinate phosphoribosyltransferase [Synergistaceae bacterium]
MLNFLDSLDDVHSLKVEPERLHSAEHQEILGGHTTDVYFVRTRDVLRSLGLLDAEVTAEVFARDSGCFAGGEEVLTLLRNRNLAVEILPEGESFASKDVVLRIRGPYGAFGTYETVLLGMLASATGWATAARECVEAAKGKKVLCFGARHVHPAVAPVMERVAMLVGGCQGASCILGAKLGGREPQGTIPHAAILVAGDTLSVASAYDALLSED